MLGVPEEQHGGPGNGWEQIPLNPLGPQALSLDRCPLKGKICASDLCAALCARALQREECMKEWMTLPGFLLHFYFLTTYLFTCCELLQYYCISASAWVTDA